ncbi:peptidyl-lys metalloendopeptidase [Rhizoctonia solani 123E]|uniref:Peptidyl-lys metalloendopeptidase n=1 Tax=Rhizoctonia solani 123E TaxID=1423351 RepID=A0A074RX39_9AGAM|nr:peptidyl-lys metalloendopeptidase [Rhizoctonia solani 123E]
MFAPIVFMMFTPLLASAKVLLALNLTIPSVDRPALKHRIQMEKPVSLKNAVVPPSVSLSSEGVKYSSCSPGQQAEIRKAIRVAQACAKSSFIHLKSNPSGSTLYTRWFGTFDKNLRGVTLLSFSRLRTYPGTWTYDCACTDSELIAQVNPKQYGIVDVCPRFWRAPMGGAKSAAFAIIREGTRFKQVIGSYDHALGQSDSLTLAKSNAREAAFNADNHAYFSMGAYIEEA